MGEVIDLGTADALLPPLDQIEIKARRFKAPSIMIDRALETSGTALSRQAERMFRPGLLFTF